MSGTQTRRSWSRCPCCWCSRTERTILFACNVSNYYLPREGERKTYSALVHEGSASLGSFSAVNVGGNGVADVGNDAGDLGAVGGSVGEDAVGDEVVGTAGGEVVQLGSVKADLDGLAGGDDLEGLLIEGLAGETETDTLEIELVAWTPTMLATSSTSEVRNYCIYPLKVG